MISVPRWLLLTLCLTTGLAANKSANAEPRGHDVMAHSVCAEELVKKLQNSENKLSRKSLMDLVSEELGGNFSKIENALAAYQKLNVTTYAWNPPSELKKMGVTIVYTTSNDKTKASFDKSYGIPLGVMDISNWQMICKEKFLSVSDNLSSFMKYDISKTTIGSRTFISNNFADSPYSITISRTKTGEIWLIQVAEWDGI